MVAHSSSKPEKNVDELSYKLEVARTEARRDLKAALVIAGVLSAVGLSVEYRDSITGWVDTTIRSIDSSTLDSKRLE